MGSLVDPRLRASYLLPLLGEWPRLPFTARIERAHSYRARSASKKGTWPLPASPLESCSSADYPLGMELPDLKDDPYLKVLRPLVEAYLAFWRIDIRHIKSLRLTPSQFDVIATLGDTEGMTCSELSAHTLGHQGHAHRRPRSPRRQGPDPEGSVKRRSPLHQDLVNRERRCAVSKDLCSSLRLSSSIL